MTPVSRTERLLNSILDSIFLCLCFMMYAVVFNFLLGLNDEESDPWFGILLIVTLFFYFFGLEYYFGKTLAKFITGTTVVDLDGKRPSAKRIFIRTIARVIPFDGFSYLFTRTGLHDELSKTIVVRDKEKI